ncbi:PREDICTED: uncharacterized protein LOC106811852 isoform X2 [Priapulus caudatus]|uniref:Uncharacterized protein LOC106811852 isoform X2 n=1 Tax=Priapulus caudatus TaxID=37621 RepID=A0ABM1EFT6_PRICU|nr:PREDICTED: uncharacterized protein LOC106811852 isoform X2 [Priapulus caudatus]
MPKLSKPLKHTVRVYTAGSRRGRLVNLKATPCIGQQFVKPSQALPHSCSTDVGSDADEGVASSNYCEEQPVLNKYMESRRRRDQSWKEIRDDLKLTHLEGQAPATLICCMCQTEEVNIIYCPDCSYSSYYCMKCVLVAHGQHTLHTPSIWKEGLMVRYEFPTIQQWEREDGHACETRLWRIIAVLDENGVQHQVQVSVCSCEPVAVTLIRYHLWPATPKNPQVAFTFNLMENLRLLVLECQVSVRSFCMAMKIRNKAHPLALSDVDDAYKTLQGGCFEEYRVFWKSLNYPSGDGYDNGTTCSLCPKDSGTAIFSMDGNFGLVRRKKAGEDLEAEKDLSDCGKSTRFFVDQTQVDQYVNNAQKDTTSKHGICSDFQAGNPLRSRSRFEKLDVTGVFGSVCRHDYPKAFFNLRHGERLAYPEFLAKHLCMEAGPQKVILLYDIACVLENHIELSTLPNENVTFAVPIFHMYGHNVACQVQYNPRRIEGMGLTDGEGVERLWSFLRRFSNITKEMTPSHRNLLLDDALLHFGEKLRSQQGDFLKRLLKKAKESIPTCEEELRKATANLEVKPSNEDNALEGGRASYSGKTYRRIT